MVRRQGPPGGGPAVAPRLESLLGLSLWEGWGPVGWTPWLVGRLGKHAVPFRLLLVSGWELCPHLELSLGVTEHDVSLTCLHLPSVLREALLSADAVGTRGSLAACALHPTGCPLNWPHHRPTMWGPSPPECCLAQPLGISPPLGTLPESRLLQCPVPSTRPQRGLDAAGLPRTLHTIRHYFTPSYRALAGHVHPSLDSNI